MAVYLFANVGNSDLQKLGADGKCIPLESQREGAKEALEFFQGLGPDDWTVVDTLYTLPILGPTVLSLCDDNRAPIDELFLFVTDQDPRTTPPQFYTKDTVITGEVIKQILLNSPTYRSKVKHVTLKPVLVSPANYDATYEEYATLFHNIQPFEGAWPADAELFAIVTGGTPQCNFSLMFHFLYHERLPLRRIVLYKNPHSRADYLSVPRSMRHEHLLGVCNELLSRHDYDGIRAIVGQSNLPGVNLLQRLLQAASFRFNFRFQEATAVLDDLRTARSGAEGAKLQRLYHQVRQLAESAERLSNNEGLHLPVDEAVSAMLEELVANLVVKFENDEGIDFLARLFRLQEAVLRLCAVTCKPAFAQGRRQGLPTHARLAEQEPDYKQYMAKHLNERFINYSLNRPILYYSIRYYLRELQDRSPDVYATVHTALDWAEKVGLSDDHADGHRNRGHSQDAEPSHLMNLRNKSIAGHGFLGLSRSQINEYYHGDILTETRTMLTALLGHPPGQPYQEQDDFIHDQLRIVFSPV
ncbi:MAG: hypothetical protein PWR31_949 [Bacillota bacterium]|nr:hypothetical protein [Bacillota bacterium]